MAITKAQREARRSCIGSSDSQVLCNVDPYRSLYDLWADKTGKLEERGSSEDAERGNLLEPVVLNWFEMRMNVRTVRDIEIRNGGVFGANLDAAILGYRKSKERHPDQIESLPFNYFPEAVVEAKTTVDGDAWGEAIDDVPERVLVQVQHQMMVADTRIAYIPVLIPKYRRFHFEIYQVMRHDDLIKQIRERGEYFWEKHVKTDIPPPDTLPHLETLKRWHREPKSVIRLDDEAAKLWTNLELAKAERKKWDKTIEEFQVDLLTKLVGAEAGELPDGARLTYLEQNSAPCTDLAVLRMKLREAGIEAIYEECVTQGRHRVLRHKKSSAK